MNACALVAAIGLLLLAPTAPKGGAPGAKVAASAPRPGASAPKGAATSPRTPTIPPSKSSGPTAPKGRPPTPAPRHVETPSVPAPTAPAQIGSSEAPTPQPPASHAPPAPGPIVAPAPPDQRGEGPALVAIDFDQPTDGTAWFVSGLEGVVADEFHRFHSLELARKVDGARCPERNPRCLVAQYRAAGAQVVVLGRLEGTSALAYRVYETWTGTRAFEGALRLSHVTTPGLKRQIAEIIRPIVQRGGLLDQRPADAPSSAVRAAAAAPSQPPSVARKSSLGVLFALAMVLVTGPALLAFALLGPRELRRRERPSSWKWSALLAAALVAIAMCAAVDVSARWLTVVTQWPLVTRAAPVAAGALWAVFALIAGSWVFAPIHGLERIRHDALWPLLRSWMVLATLRATALVAIYAPLCVLVFRTCSAVGVSERATIAWLPAGGLLTHFALLALVDNLSSYLDAKLVSGPPTRRNPWHATIERYFRGYVRRGVVPVNDALLDRTLFLPSSRGDVVSYGGGFARPRIAVGQKPLEIALGELPDEEAFPDRTVNPEELPLGILAPSLTPEAALARAEQWRRRLTLAPARPRAHVPRLLGENATLLGWVLPQSTEKGIPLISDTEEDFGVVKRLLSEHYGAFSGLLDDEVDDTDPSQKDFLFGALLREVGVVARHDVLFSTIGLFVEVASADKGWLGVILRLPLTLYKGLLAAPGAKVADAYSALNGALHPLIQYLCLLRAVDETLLTARANAPRLTQTSREMLARLDRGAPSSAADGALRARAAWLAHFSYEPVAPPGIPWVRVIAGVAAAAALCAVAAKQVSVAIAYHPTYTARMKSLETAVTQGDTR